MVKRKFYAIGHNPNTIEEAGRFMQAGFNALGPDLNFSHGKYYISHDALPESEIEKRSLINYLQGLRTFAEHGLAAALIVFDVKAPVFNINNCLQLIHQHYLRYEACKGTAIVFTTAKLKDEAFVTTFNNEIVNAGVGIDEHPNPFEVWKALGSLKNSVYGNGITTLLPKPGLYNSIRTAKYIQAIGGFKMVLVWVLSLEDSLRSYLKLGVDGILTDLKDTGTLLNLLQQPDFAARYELAQPGHNPFTNQLPAYGLTIKTSDRFLAGTNGQICLTLSGTQGSLDTTIDAGLYNTLEKGNLDYFALEGKDIGAITSLTVELLSESMGDGWLPEFIEVKSGLHQTVTFNYSPTDWLNKENRLITKTPPKNSNLLV